MKLNDVFYLAILTITVITSSVRADNGNKLQEFVKDKVEKKIVKRDAILIDSIPVESSYPQAPKVIYRRVSRQRYLKSKPKRIGPRPKYGPPKSRRPVKKYRGKSVKPKYGPPSIKKRPPKPSYGPPKSSHGKRKPVYGPPKKQRYQSSYVPQEPVGFAEPPMEFNDYQPQNNYAPDPPTDSYGAPLVSNMGSNGYSDPGYSYDQPTAASFNIGQEFFGNHYQQASFQPPWQKDQGFSYNDNAHAHSQKYVTKAKPFGGQPFRDEPSEDYSDDEQPDTYTEFYNHKPFVNDLKKKPQVFGDQGMFVNRPKKVPKLPSKDPLVVGGQYAEPPPRYMPTFHPSSSSFVGDEFAGAKGFADSDAAGSSVSSYVNYKNSNMAFSPQNLNDAFSIID